jgi:hypothetical protein
MDTNKKIKIKIKPENKGTFTSYCKSNGYNGVTADCIARGKKSALERIRKRAIFAENSRKWH